LYNQENLYGLKTLACFKSGKLDEVILKLGIDKMDNWIINYRIFVEELNRMLGLHFKWDKAEYQSGDEKTPVGASIIMAGIFHAKRDYKQRNNEIAKLGSLVNELQLIEKYNKNILNNFKKMLLDSQNSLGSYFGARMEIHIAASLIDKRVSFIKTESPDFILDEYGIYIECTSSHRSNNSTAHLIAKIRSAVTQKSKKAYCNQSTVLCVDVTNISATTVKDENEFLSSRDRLKETVIQIIRDTNSDYGSILLFLYFVDLESKLHIPYFRIDSDKIDPTLKEFLDKYYSIGEYKTGPGWTLKSG
jgi:hypothetical protein